MKTKDLIDYFDNGSEKVKTGSQAEIARILGITRQSVNRWGEVIPTYQLEQLRLVAATDAFKNRYPKPLPWGENEDIS